VPVLDKRFQTRTRSVTDVILHTLITVYTKSANNCSMICNDLTHCKFLPLQLKGCLPASRPGINL